MVQVMATGPVRRDQWLGTHPYKPAKGGLVPTTECLHLAYVVAALILVVHDVQDIHLYPLPGLPRGMYGIPLPVILRTFLSPILKEGATFCFDSEKHASIS